jgi:hypothetical protein
MCLVRCHQLGGFNEGDEGIVKRMQTIFKPHRKIGGSNRSCGEGST